MALPEEATGYNLRLPTGLLATPSVDRPACLRGRSTPGSWRGSRSAVVLAGLGAMLLWRRRVRP